MQQSWGHFNRKIRREVHLCISKISCYSATELEFDGWHLIPVLHERRKHLCMESGQIPQFPLPLQPSSQF